MPLQVIVFPSFDGDMTRRIVTEYLKQKPRYC